VYNTPAYVEFAHTQNGSGDLLWLAREGAPMLGLPVHPIGAVRVTTGYSGAMFADGPRDAVLRRGVAALEALLGANRKIGFEVLQATQSPAYDNPTRIAGLTYLLEREGHEPMRLYSRILDVEPIGRGSGEMPEIGSDLLLEQGLEPYQPELRNQIRQAIRSGLSVSCALPTTDAELQSVYSEFVVLHEESWRRTGMVPHSHSYWVALGQAILDGGGRDMVVCARDGDGRAVAAVTCHFRGERALYWAGASSERGLAARANPLCLHAAIQACRQLGVRHFELGRLHARESVEKELAILRYKSQFGGGLVPLAGLLREPSLLARALGRLG
jgi:hypothetical protein